MTEQEASAYIDAQMSAWYKGAKLRPLEDALQEDVASGVITRYDVPLIREAAKRHSQRIVDNP